MDADRQLQRLAAAEADRRDEHEVEQLLLRAGPRIWQSTQNVLRDIGGERWARTPLAPLREDDDDDDDGDDDDRAQRRLAAAEAEVAAQMQEQRRLRHRQRSATPAPAPGVQPSLSTDSPTGAPPDPAVDAAGDDRVCRLCFGEEDELNDDGSSMGRLISPCRCRGSMKYVHTSCLSQWRQKSKATEAARICGQCGCRYLFHTSRWTPVAAFLQANQPLKIVVSFLVVAAFVVLSGAVGTACLYTVAKLQGTRLDGIRSTSLALLEPPRAPWNITLSQDAYEATVNFDSTLDEVQGMYGSRKELMIRASLDVIQKIKREHGDEWAAYKRAQQELDASKAGAEAQDEAPEGDEMFEEDDLLDVRDEGGQHIDKKIRRRRRQNDGADRDEEGIAPANRTGGAGDDGLAETKRPKPPIDPARFAQALTNRLMQLWSGHMGDDTPTDATDDSGDADDQDLPSSDSETTEDEIATASTQAEADGSVAADGGETATSEPGNSKKKKKKRGSKGPELAISYNFGTARTFGVDPENHVLVRFMPSWLGPLRFLFYAFYLTACERLRGLERLPSYLWTTLTRCAVLLSVLVCESRREILWTVSKVVVGGAIAFIDEHFQAAPPLPPNAVLLGPPRSRSRRWAWWVREALSFASTTVFGLYWLNWWGGLSMSAYLGPRSFSSEERVELSQLGPVVGPLATNVVDLAFVVLSGFSERAHRFRQSHTRWWRRADWVQHDKSAAEGYRRLLSVLLGDEGQAQMTRYDVFLERENARLLPGRVRPVQLARLALPSSSSSSSGDGGGGSLWATIVMVGCLVTVVVACAASLCVVWEAVLLQFYQQAMRSTLDLLKLVASCGPRLLALPRMLYDGARSSLAAVRGYWPFSSMQSSGDGGPAAGDAAATNARGPDMDRRNDHNNININNVGVGGGGGGDDDDALSLVVSAVVGCCASIYGCFHGSLWIVKLMLTYLPFAPFAMCVVGMEEWIHFDVAQQEVLDRQSATITDAAAALEGG